MSIVSVNRYGNYEEVKSENGASMPEKYKRAEAVDSDPLEILLKAELADEYTFINPNHKHTGNR